jgi:membrane protease YdiL (CAAX protease family)
MVFVLAVYVGLFAVAGVLVYFRYGPVISLGILATLSNGLTPGGVLMLLFSFTGLAAGSIAAARLLHGRRGETLFGGPLPALVRDFGKVAITILAMNGLVALFSVAGSEGVVNRNGWGLAPFYPFALVGLLIQVGSEELFFRGYLLQQLAARYRSRLVWMGLPAVMFALGHYSPGDYGAATWIVVVWAGVFGLLSADLVARTGNLGASIGFHFATNAVSLFLVGIKGNIDGLALWSVPMDVSSLQAVLPTVGADFLSIVVGWLAARLVLRV